MNRQSFITILLTIFMSMTGAKSFAHDIEAVNNDGVTIYYVWTNNNTELAVSYRGSSFDSYNEYTGNVVIPESVDYNGNTYPVTSIGGWAFFSCRSLTSITIPNSVTSIGDGAFSGCDGLTSFTIPNSVTSIGSAAFMHCSGLTSVTIPNSVTSIGNQTFYGCDGLTSVTIGNSVASIGSQAFLSWSSSALTSINVESGNQYYDSRNNCNAIIETASNTLIVGCKNTTIPNSVTSIGSEAFKGCSGLTSVTIPNSVTSIGGGAFGGCYGMKSITSKIEEPFAINENVFENKNALLKVPYGTKSAYQATAGWKNFEKIEEMPYDPSTIPENIVFPSYAVKAVCLANWDTNNDGELNMDEAAAVTDLGTVFQNNLKITSFDELQYFTGLTEIAENAFQGCSALNSVIIPNRVISIGSSAFKSCSGLTSITIPNSVTSIGSYAFLSCSGLTSIIVESGNQYYDSRNNCNAIIETTSNTLIVGCKNTTIPNGVTSIGNSAFSDCSGLTSINIPNSVTSIDYCAFFDCSGLTSVTIPNSVKSIGSSAFYACSGLTSINVESGNQYYDSRNNCNAIIETASNTLILGCKNTTIPNNVTSIGGSAFFGCSGLTSITIPNSVTSIGGWTFNGCSGLTSVTIPNSVTSIGNSAFSWCSKLSRIISEIEMPFEIGTIADTSVTLIVPVGTKAAYQSTAGWSSFKNIFEVGEGGDVGSKFEIDGICYTIEENNTASLTSVNKGISDAVVIPEQVEFNGKKSYVTSIGERAFDGCSSLTSVTIPNRVISINSYAFRGCSSLTSVIIGKSVTSIGSYAFSGCSGLTSVTIPNSVTSIDSYAFQNCRGLTSVNISELSFWCYILFGNKEANPLYYAHHLFLNGVEVVELNIPDGVTSIGCYAFCGCSELTSVTIPNSVIKIGNGAFDGCDNLSLVLPDRITKRTIHVEKAGTLKEIISDEMFLIEELTLTGELNGTDIKFINEMAGKATSTNANYPHPYTETEGKLRSLDITNTRIVKGGDVYDYYIIEDGKLRSLSTEDNVITPGLFDLTKLESILLPNSVTSISGMRYMSEYGKIAYMGAFPDCLKSITIPQSVTSINAYAFCECTSLNSIKVESGNQYYDSRNNCNAIIETASNTLIVGCKNTTIPNGVTSIGEWAFYNCSGLASVTIPNNVISIGGYAFRGCSSLTSVTIPNSLTSIGGSAFFGCSGLTSVTFPNSVTSIGDYAFSGCSSLTSITSEIEEPFAINENVFSNKNALLKVPTGTKSLYKATDGWKSFKNIVEDSSPKRTIHVATAGTLPDLISEDEKYLIAELTLTGELNGTDIHFIRDMAGINMDRMKYGDTEFHPGEYAKTNGQLRVLDLSDAIIVEGGRDYYRMLTSDVRMTFDNYEYTKPNEISDRMFDSCWKLEELTLPNSVTFISSLVFGYNKIASPIHVNSIHVNIKSLKVADGNPTYESPGDCKAIIEKETNTLILGCSNSKIPENVASIGKRAFYGCGDLTSITIPNSVTSIGDDAFYSCSGLTSINVESGNQYYDSRNNCNAIIETASNKLLWGCKNTTIPTSVTSIGKYAFEWCSGLTSITIPESVTSIGNHAFYGSGLTSVTIGNSVTSIGEYAFEWCGGLTSVTIGNSVASIGKRAFYFCTGLTSVHISDIKAWCDIVFDGDDSNPLYYAHHLYQNGEEIKELTIPSDIKTIDNYAFYGCTGLTSITIPNSVTSIGSHAFYGCSGLASVIIDKQEPLTILSTTFSNQANATLYVPKGCKAAYEAADYWKEFKEIKEFAKDEEVICVLEDDNTAKVTAANDPTEKDVVIPESVMIGEESLPVTSIGDNAFKDNTDLALVCIPETVEEIGENAFAGCSGLTAIYSYSEEPIALGSSKATIRTRSDGDEVSASSVFANVDKESCILYVPKNCGNKYRNAIGWGEFQNIVEMISTKPGDANNDGNVDSLDVDATVGYIMEGKTVNFIFKNADVKTDSKINAADIVEIVNLK